MPGLIEFSAPEIWKRRTEKNSRRDGCGPGWYTTSNMQLKYVHSYEGYSPVIEWIQLVHVKS